MDPEHAPVASSPTAGTGADHHIRRLEGEIEDTCVELGRTAVELGERLSPSALAADVKNSLRATAIDTTRAAARTAGDFASTTAERTHDAAIEATAQVRAHPLMAAGAGAAAMWLLWASSEGGRQRGALSRGIPIALAWTGVWLLWRGRSDEAAVGRVSI